MSSHTSPPEAPPQLEPEPPVPPRAQGPPFRRERRRRAPGWSTWDVLRAAAAVLALYWAMRFLWMASALVLAAFMGVLFGLAVSRGVDVLQERLHLRRGVGAPLIVFSSIGLIVAFFAWSGPALAEQSRELRTKLPEALDNFEDWVNRQDSGFLSRVLGIGPDSAAPAADSAAQGTARPPGSLAAQRDSLGARSVLRDRAADALAGATRYLFPFLSSTFAVIAGLVLVIFLAIYVAAEPDVYHAGLMHLFPHRVRRRAGEVLSAMALALRRWLLTQLVAMVVIGTVTTIVLLVLGVPAALPLGLLAGLLEFVPNVGPILSAVPAVVMGFVESPQLALWVAIAYWVIQFLENQLLIPILMRENVDLPPALTLVTQAMMALLFGFLGLLVAVPMLAAGLVAVKMLYVEDVVGDEVEIFEGEDDDD